MSDMKNNEVKLLPTGSLPHIGSLKGLQTLCSIAAKAQVRTVWQPKDILWEGVLQKFYIGHSFQCSNLGMMFLALSTKNTFSGIGLTTNFYVWQVVAFPHIHPLLSSSVLFAQTHPDLSVLIFLFCCLPPAICFLRLVSGNLSSQLKRALSQLQDTHKTTLSSFHSVSHRSSRAPAKPCSSIIQHVHNFTEELNGWSDICSASETS